MTMYFSKLELDRTAGNAALASLLDPDDPSQALDAHHKLLWTVFGDENPDRERDFLFRSAGRGRFYVLSKRPPAEHPLFRLQTSEYGLNLAPGDRLAFSLRVNATVAKDREEHAVRKNGRSGPKGTRVDIVMDRLHQVPKGERAAHRMQFAHEAATDWMTQQGKKHGFELEDPEDLLRVESYTTQVLPRRGRQGPNLGILDLSGILRVTNPEKFAQRVHEGFGRSKAFGCGLMMLRRA
jgi:CRISPR system Cascade subunit CasE